MVPNFNGFIRVGHSFNDLSDLSFEKFIEFLKINTENLNKWGILTNTYLPLEEEISVLIPKEIFGEEIELSPFRSKTCHDIGISFINAIMKNVYRIDSPLWCPPAIKVINPSVGYKNIINFAYQLTKKWAKHNDCDPAEANIVFSSPELENQREIKENYFANKPKINVLVKKTQYEYSKYVKYKSNFLKKLKAMQEEYNKEIPNFIKIFYS